MPCPIGSDGRKRSSTRRQYSTSRRAAAVRVPVKYRRLIWLLVRTRNSKQSLAIQRSRSVRCDASRNTSSSPSRFGRTISQLSIYLLYCRGGLQAADPGLVAADLWPRGASVLNRRGDRRGDRRASRRTDRHGTLPAAATGYSVGQQRCQQPRRLALHLRREPPHTRGSEAHAIITTYTFIHSLLSAGREDPVHRQANPGAARDIRRCEQSSAAPDTDGHLTELAPQVQGLTRGLRATCVSFASALRVACQ